MEIEPSIRLEILIPTQEKVFPMRTPNKTLVVGMVSSFVLSTTLTPTALAKKPVFDLPPAEKIEVAPEASASAPAAAPPVALPVIKLEPQT